MAFETFFDCLFLIVKRKGRNEVVDQRDWSDFCIVGGKKIQALGNTGFRNGRYKLGIDLYVEIVTWNRSAVRSGPRLNLFSKVKFRSRFF